MFGMISSICDHVQESVSDFIDDPIGETINIVTQPLRDGVNIIDGLTEGELRVMATARLGLNVASGMGVSELLEWYSNSL